MSRPEPVGQRRITRWVMGLVVVILGVVAATRVELAYLPTWTFPELEARLTVSNPTDVEELTRRYVVPLESAIRTLGQVRGHAGEVSNRGAELRVRFEPGTNAERKAARLESELQSLRRKLPEASTIEVEPIQQGAGSASSIVWLPGEPGEAPEALVQALQDLPEVQEVWVAGRRRLEVRLTAPALYGGRIRRELAQPVGESRLGRWREGNRNGLVLSGIPENWDPMQRAVRQGESALRLGSVAHKDLRREEPRFAARVNGEPGQVLLLYREYDASPLAFSRAVNRALSIHGYGEAEVLMDEADPLRQVLRRGAMGLVAAILLLSIAQLVMHGSPWVLHQAFVLPLALAAAVNATWAVGISLDVTTLPALMMTMASALTFQVLRRPGQRPWVLVWVALAACSLPVAVVLVGGPLGAFLGAPAKLFAVGAPAACLATLIIPATGAPKLLWVRRLLRWVMRNPWAVLLGGTTLCYGLFVLFGKALAPHPGRLVSSPADITLSLRLAEGSTLAEAEKEVARAEAFLGTREEVSEFWSIVYRRSALVYLTLKDEERSWLRMQALSARYEAQLAHVGASLTARPLAGYGGQKPIRFDEALADKAEADREITYYRFILHSTDLQRLRTAYARALDSFSASYWRPTPDMILPDWGEPSSRVELVPLPGVDQPRIERAIEVLRDRSLQPAARSAGRLPGTDQDVVLRVLGDESPEDERFAPELEDLLRARALGEDGDPFSPMELFHMREGLTSPVIKRQGGSFVLPVTIRFLYLALGQREPARSSLARALKTARLPPGVSLERPRLRHSYWTADRKRLLSIVLTLPLLLLGLVICRLGSVSLGLAALSPGVFSLALVSPMVQGLRENLDEMMLLALVTGLATTLPLAAEAAAAIRVERLTPLAAARGYRWLMQRLPSAFGTALAWAVLFAVPAIGLDAERFPWAPGFLIAAAIGPIVILGSFLFLPVLLRSVDLVRLRDPEVVAKKASPPAWARDTDPISLSARNLCKTYRNGFRALQSMDFHLEPGIVGLLGPNGAGKTTLLRTLCGLLEPTRGQVLFRGEPVTPENRALYRRLVGFLPQTFNAYEEITVADFLDYWALEMGLQNTRQRRDEIDRVLHQVGLGESGGKRVRNLSGGMRRRIGIARALLGSPPILIVDEPTTGLDVESRNRLRESLLSVASERIILFSTHIASDVAATASRILLMNHGRLLFDGTAGELMQEAHGRIFECLVEDDELRDFSKRFRVTTRVRTFDGIRVRAVAGADQAPGGRIVQPNLEEAYLAKLDLAPQGIKGRREGSLLDLGIEH